MDGRTNPVRDRVALRWVFSAMVYSISQLPQCHGWQMLKSNQTNAEGRCQLTGSLN